MILLEFLHLSQINTVCILLCSIYLCLLTKRLKLAAKPTYCLVKNAGALTFLTIKQLCADGLAEEVIWL